MKILLGLTGSVATVLYEKLIKELQTIGDVDVILTERSKHFVSDEFLKGVKVWTDADEWTWYRAEMIQRPGAPHITQNFEHKWKKGDRVLHIELRDKASALVIAPCSANTLAKISNGICDNLLTSVARAWDMNRPLVIAPAMNTHMWEHPITEKHLVTFAGFSRNNAIIRPQKKMLACNTEGMGAMAEIQDIRNFLKTSLKWFFPLCNACCNGIPSQGHAGAFLTKRKYHTHTGVDLYTTDNEMVYAVEDGVVVNIEDFTGVAQQTPWWEDTRCILVEGASGVVCYGEITPRENLYIGSKVLRGEYIANVKRVLKPGKERPDIDGHSTSMLHIEMYKHGINRAFEEVGDNLSKWSDLVDPTPFLMNATCHPSRILKP